MPSIPLARASSRTLIGLALLGMLAAPAAAQWMWRDAGGQVTASDRPPPKDIPQKDILQRPENFQRRAPAPAPAASAASAGASATTTKTALESEVEARKRAGEQENAAKARADAERVAQQRAENCRRARGHVAALESGQRMARTNDKGEREVLDDKGRAEEMRAAREVMASDCR
jgi:hypothetical protein